jgi:hypothetical protein
VNVGLAGILLGKEVTTFFVVSPGIRALPVPTQVVVQQSIGPRFRALGPVVFNLVLLTGVGFSIVAEGTARYLAIAGTLCIAVMQALMLKESVPINVWTNEQTPDVDPDEWIARRGRWDTVQVARLVLDLVALTCFLVALLLAA